MIQFYLLSILFNVVAGMALLGEDHGEENTVETGIRFSFQNETFRLLLGLFTMSIGLLKLLSPVQGDVPVVGDLVPAVAGLGSGFILLVDYYRNRTALVEERVLKITETVARNRRWAGFAAIVAAVLHFLFPHAFLL
jgi:hypothetical protein